jgi:hypothetical protein
MARSRAAEAPRMEAPAPAAQAATAEDVAALRRQLADLTDAYSGLKAATGGLTILQPDETPVYELTQPWYSPDDVYYPAGTQVEDVTGSIVPNEFMVPLNEAAEDRMTEYLQRLPTQGTPNLEFIIQAAMELRPREGDDPRLAAEYNARVLERAMMLKFKAEGRLAPEPGDRPRLPVRMPVRQGETPIMPNTNIRQGDRFGGDYRSRFMPGQTRGQRPAATRMRQVAPSAAERVAPVLGTVASQPLGNVGPGVQAY